MTAAADPGTIAETGKKKNSVTLNKAEVLSGLLKHLSTDAMSDFAAKESGWNITADNNDKSIYWLEQGWQICAGLLLRFKKRSKPLFCQNATRLLPVSDLHMVQQQTTTVQQNNNSQPNCRHHRHSPISKHKSNTRKTITAFARREQEFQIQHHQFWWRLECHRTKSDWVEVTKGSIKVLLHYPKEGHRFSCRPRTTDQCSMEYFSGSPVTAV